MFTPTVAEVSAMCSSDGITVQLMFAEEFFGKIYSQNYAHEHDCVYYNTYSMNMVMFSIPNLKCGTKVQRNGANLVTKMENEVYVQYDKDTQTAHDRRFLFICELASSSIDASNTNLDNTIGGGGSGGGTRFGSLTDRFTVTPAQTVIVETITPTRIVVTQSSLDRPADVRMEIQSGVGPYRPPVSGPLKLGDVITLVVRASRADSTVDGGAADGYSIFVHSCFAKDGTGHQSVMLIDERGCTARPQVAGRMQRARTATGDALYYFRMNAFKFPGPNDVYFTCTVDVCHDCEFKEICPAPGIGNRVVRRLRAMPNNYLYGPADTTADDVRAVQLHDYVRITDELPQDTAAQQEQFRRWQNEDAWYRADDSLSSYWSSVFNREQRRRQSKPTAARPAGCSPTGLTLALAAAVGLAILFAAIAAFLTLQLRAARRLPPSTDTLCTDRSRTGREDAKCASRSVAAGSSRHNKVASVGVKLPSLRAFPSPP